MVAQPPFVPEYIPREDRSLLRSPFMPTEPTGYAYSPPALKDIGSATIVIFDDKYAPLHHFRVVVYADGSGRVLKMQ